MLFGVSESQSDESKSRVEVATAPLIGQLCWGVGLGVDFVFRLDFGEPHLRIREPYESKSDSERIRPRAARRWVVPVGTWCFHTHVCHWVVRQKGKADVGIDDSEDEMRDRFLDLDGQRLVGVEYDRDRATRCWHFDLGGAVVFRPHEDTESDKELWALFEPDGMVFSLRADGSICYMPGDTPPDAHVWVPDTAVSG